MTATVALTAEFACGLGGARFAQWLAGLCVLGAGIFLADGVIITTDMLQALTWLACGWFLVQLAQTRDERWWIAFGLVAGISLTANILFSFIWRRWRWVWWRRRCAPRWRGPGSTPGRRLRSLWYCPICCGSSSIIGRFWNSARRA
jgi:hypothetical protein